ncbi:MAG: acyltransferase family protein [Bacteroidota bacterium]|jgi:peptidoglycan/LPS O-acetylase OafA/YrhL
MIYFPKLDSLRFIAFFLVFWSHNFVSCFDRWKNDSWRIFLNPFFETGINGVHIFFVISGFLITHLLIHEHREQQGINIKNFYLRRILRIWPLYYLIMILGLFVLPNLTSVFEFCGSYWMNLTFLNNFNIIENNNCFSTHVVIAWSVAIEEQFYLFWPIAFSLFYKKDRLILFCFIVLIASIILNPHFLYFSTICNLNYLMTGCIGALFFDKYREVILASFITQRRWLFAIVVLTCTTMLYTENYASSNTISLILLPVFYLYFVLYTVVNNDGKKSYLSFLGKYTYGMYFYHPIIAVLVRIVFDKIGIPYLGYPLNFALASVIALIITVVVSILSYQYFEGYFLRLKKKFSTVSTRI